MARYVAFLRAINVGGHNVVSMDRLRQVFESMSYQNVQTFIASGNVIFETRSPVANALEKKIEKILFDSLGYEVTTFLRTVEQLQDIADFQPFAPKQLKQAVALNIGFVRHELDRTQTSKLQSLAGLVDQFCVRGREVYWMSTGKQSESKFSGKSFEKTVGQPVTFRSNTTLQKLASKLQSP